MDTIDLGRYKRMIQYLWDAEPKNDQGAGLRIWCLGKEYVTPEKDEFPADINITTDDSSIVHVTSPGQEPITATTNYNHKNNTANAETADRNSDEVQPERLSSSSPSSSSFTVVGSTTTTTTATESPKSLGWPKPFLDDFESKIWMTYRSNFPLIPKSEDANATQGMSFTMRLRSQLTDQGFTSDTGWGCMIRSGQSLLANALAITRLGRDWRRGERATEENQLLSLFADDPAAPFSIHRFVRHGAEVCGKQPGQWFGPSAAATCIRALSEEYKDTGMRVYMSHDNTYVSQDKFRAIAYDETGHMHPTLILLGTRLGIDRIAPAYRLSLGELLKLPQSLGIAGGRPSSSHYFIGMQNSFLFYLDPHHTRPALPFKSGGLNYTQEEIDSCHTRRLRRIHVDDMDPSMLIGFLIRDEDDWRDWKQRILASDTADQRVKAIVHVVDTDSDSTTEREAALDEVEVLDDDDAESELA